MYLITNRDEKLDFSLTKDRWVQFYPDNFVNILIFFNF